MPVASYIDIEILCLVRLIGMCIPDKHIRRGSDDPLGRPPWDKGLSEIFVRSFSDPCVRVLMRHLDSCRSIYLLERIVSTNHN